MKILIGGLVAESNAYVAKPCEIQDFVIQTGEDIAHRMYLDELQPELQANDIELIPAIFAYGAGAGRVAYDTFDYILKQFKHAVEKYQGELDGMFFFLHGASNVIGLKAVPATTRSSRKSAGSSGRTCRSRSSVIRMATSIRSTQTD